MPALTDALRALESLFSRGIELVELYDRDDDGLVTDALASDDSHSTWPEIAAP